MKDRAYFASLSAADQRRVRRADPIGEVDLSDERLETVSGGLSGGDHLESTTTTTDQPSCSCSAQASAARRLGRTATEGHRFTPECVCVC